MFYQSANLIITSSVMGVLAIVAVGLRFWAKGLRKLRVGIDDILIVIALVLALGLSMCNIIGAAEFRFGDHEIFIDSGPLTGWPVAWLLLGYGKIFYAIQLLHSTAMPVIKASLMIFLNQIFGHNRRFRLALRIIGAYVFLWWLTTFWMSVFQCWPISSNWGTTPEEMGDCIPNYMTWYAWAALLNVLSDVAIVITPIPLIWQLQMPVKQKLAVLALLTTAIIVVVAGIGRTVGFFTYDSESLDFSYVFYDFLIWTSIEPCLGVVGCCLPLTRPLLDAKFLPIYTRIKSSFASRRTTSDEADPGRTLAPSDEHLDRVELKTDANSHRARVYETSLETKPGTSDASSSESHLQ